MKDVQDKAEMWIDDKCPTGLYFNHGEFINGGMDHILTELERKPTSNRAFYSLVSTKEINDSGDKPIPSFLTLQCKVINTELVCSVTFRALEASTFFRVNLEEIRQRLKKIIVNLNYITTVNLTIYSFFTYINETQSMLERPVIDTMTVSKLSHLFVNKKDDLILLVKEKSKPTTVVDISCFKKLKEFFDDNPPNLESIKIKSIIGNLDRVIEDGESLKQARRVGSDIAQLDPILKKYNKSIKRLTDIL